MSTLRVDSIQGQTAGTDRYVVQVINQTTETAVNASGATVTSTGLSLSITPKSVNNKILVMGSVNGVMTNAVNTGIRISVHRGSASSDTKISNAQEYAAYDTASTDNQVNVPFSVLDSPATTSAQTYSVYFTRTAGSGTARVQSNGSQSNITLMEIAQ